MNDLKLRGHWEWEILKDGKSLEKGDMPNGLTDPGLDSLLDVYFNAATQINNWYIGLIDDAGFTALAAADTMASHAGWAEFTTYTEATRPEWAPDAPSTQLIQNGTARTFNITASATLKGIFVTSDSAKSGTAGTLWSTALFGSDKAVSNGTELKLTYKVSASE